MLIRIFINPEGLRRILLQRGWTQGTLAIKIGVSGATVSRWLQEQQSLTPDKAKRMHELLRARWDDIFGKIISQVERKDASRDD